MQIERNISEVSGLDHRVLIETTDKNTEMKYSYEFDGQEYRTKVFLSEPFTFKSGEKIIKSLLANAHKFIERLGELKCQQ